MKRRGFTMIELLMVIALIGLLMTLVVPGLTAARRYAQRVTCAGNLKALGNAFSSYYSETFTWPRRVDPGGVNEWDDAMYEQMFRRYLTDPRVLYCPDNSDDRQRPGPTWDKTWTGEKRVFSYAILDGMPGDPDITKVGDEWQMEAYRRYRTGSSGPYQDEYVKIRPDWGSLWDERNGPMAGDLVIERTRDNENWTVNHPSGGPREPPLGMNILFRDGRVSWVTSENPASDEKDRKKQYLWTRIYKKSDTEYVQWVWNPTTMELPPREQ